MGEVPKLMILYNYQAMLYTFLYLDIQTKGGIRQGI